MVETMIVISSRAESVSPVESTSRTLLKFSSDERDTSRVSEAKEQVCHHSSSVELSKMDWWYLGSHHHQDDY